MFIRGCSYSTRKRFFIAVMLMCSAALLQLVVGQVSPVAVDLLDALLKFQPGPWWLYIVSVFILLSLSVIFLSSLIMLKVATDEVASLIRTG